jgi:hypothetical protein
MTELLCIPGLPASAHDGSFTEANENIHYRGIENG